MHTRRLRKVAAVVGTLLAVFATSVGVAFANAANPLPDSKGTGIVSGTVRTNADQSITVLTGSVGVTVQGTWDWGTLSGSSTQSSCANRYGVGWAVDGNPSNPRVITELRRTGELGQRCRCRR